MTLRRLRGRPRWPVRTLTASRNGSTGARSSPLAGVVRFAKGMPLPSVRLWISMPLPFPPRAMPSPPPLPGGKSAIDGAILPTNHASFLGYPQNACLHCRQCAIRLPAPQPAMRGTLRRPLQPPGDITPPAAGNQNIQQRIQHFPKRCMRHPTTALGRCRGKDILEQAPLQLTHAFKSPCHTALLRLDRTVYHKNCISGIDSYDFWRIDWIPDATVGL